VDQQLSASLINDILYLPSCHWTLKSCPEVCAVRGRPLSRLGGQPRPPCVSSAAEEIILRRISADDYDAALAERYGWINRALPDEELESYVTALAHRIARFPQAALLTLKERVNAITLASEVDFRRDSELFGKGFHEGGEARARTAILIKRGLQTRSETELNLGRVLGELDNLNEQTG
jgi:hypothetical protein